MMHRIVRPSLAKSPITSDPFFACGIIEAAQPQPKEAEPVTNIDNQFCLNTVFIFISLLQKHQSGQRRESSGHNNKKQQVGFSLAAHLGAPSQQLATTCLHRRHSQCPLWYSQSFTPHGHRGHCGASSCFMLYFLV